MNFRNKYHFLMHSKRLRWLNDLSSKHCNAGKYFFTTCFEKTNTEVNKNFSTAYYFLPNKEGSVRCYNCQSEIKVDAVSFTCKKCNCLVGAEVFKHFNIFELFNLDIEYDVNKQLLKQRFNNVQKLFHPDKHSQHANLEMINEASGYLNNAYRLLNDDTERAVYLLKLLFNYKTDENENIEDEEFLQEIVKINDQIDSSEDVETLKKKYENEYQSHIAALKLYFKEKKYDNIVHTIKKMRFIGRFLERINNM